jgi:hypothetical protein
MTYAHGFREYFKWWQRAGETTVIAHQDAVAPEWYTRQAFFYAFSMAVPNVTPRESIDGPLVLTDYGQKILDVVMTSVARANRARSDIQIDLLEVQKLSDGIVCTQKIAIQKTLESLHSSCSTPTESDHDKPLLSILSGVEFVRSPVASQFLGIGFVGASGSMLASARLLLPAGFPVQQAEDEIDAYCKKFAVESIRLPEADVNQYRRNGLGVPFVRWIDGNWHDSSMLKLGPKGKDILQTGEWAVGWDACLPSSTPFVHHWHKSKPNSFLNSGLGFCQERACSDTLFSLTY